MQDQTPLQNPSKPSRWSNYLKEFLMLFLAVFCGYLVEEYREQQQEKEVVSRYLASLEQDLVRDSIELEKTKALTKSKLLHTDSLWTELMGERYKSDSWHLYYYSCSLLGFPDFISNNGSMEQLKYSGSLSHIESKEVVDSLMAYQQALTLLKLNEGILNSFLANGKTTWKYFNLKELTLYGNTKKIPILEPSQSAQSEMIGTTIDWLNSLNALADWQVIVAKRGESLRRALRRRHFENLRGLTNRDPTRSEFW